MRDSLSHSNLHDPPGLSFMHATRAIGVIYIYLACIQHLRFRGTPAKFTSKINPQGFNG